MRRHGRRFGSFWLTLWFVALGCGVCVQKGGGAGEGFDVNKVRSKSAVLSDDA